MRIAVTYENGEIFQHFGHTAYFKVFRSKRYCFAAVEHESCEPFGEEEHDRTKCEISNESNADANVES